jgi:hypothetical protein
MLKAAWLLAFLLVNSSMLTALSSQPNPTVKVGAWGDDASRDNLGVEAQIQTHAYDSYPNTLDYFWVGDILADGAFIQFGYSLQVGLSCLRGTSVAGKSTCLGATQIIFGSDARWEWQYWPNRYAPDFYYGIGSEGSAGMNGTWHRYTIEAGLRRTWNFVIDGQAVAETNFTESQSTDPILVVAERSPAANVSWPLGPVAFKGLAYFDGESWRQSDSLIALNSCATSAECLPNSYGSVALNAGSLIAGSNVPNSPDGSLLWTRSYVHLDVDVHSDVHFYITSVSITRVYNGTAQVDLPQGMLAYVSLLDPTTSSPGILGLMGGQDHFQEWTGVVNSRNLTVQLLMNSNGSIKAEWTSDATPILVATATLVLIVVALIALGFNKRRTPSRLT